MMGSKTQSGDDHVNGQTQEAHPKVKTETGMTTLRAKVHPGLAARSRSRKREEQNHVQASKVEPILSKP